MVIGSAGRWAASLKGAGESPNQCRAFPPRTRSVVLGLTAHLGSCVLQHPNHATLMTHSFLGGLVGALAVGMTYELEDTITDADSDETVT